ncbi:EF-hand calcium-binding domain-containing protein 1 [Armadillidium vulgare]|nr:EF-hand calcium-binding domain-containing protein 1 [Armadillidium vulgare]
MKSKLYKGHASSTEKLSRLSHFTIEEVEALINMYNKITGSKVMDTSVMRDVLHAIFQLSNELLIERVCQVFDKDQDGLISEEEFVSGLSVFLKGTLEEKIKYCFSVYDHNGDQMVSKEEIQQQLKSFVINIPSGEEYFDIIKDLVDFVLRRLDNDRDGRVSYDDYAASVISEPLLMEVLGSCLPDITVT